jgi:hypothetical protein
MRDSRVLSVVTVALVVLLAAAFYLPGAVLGTIVESCTAKEFSVGSAKLDNDVFTAEPTQNPAAFMTRAEREGEAHFTAELVIDGEPVSVHNTIRASRA